MILTKQMAVVTVLAAASAAVGQEQANEHRIAELIKQLDDDELRGETVPELIALGQVAADALLEALDRGSYSTATLRVLDELVPYVADEVRDLLSKLNEFPPEHLPALFRVIGTARAFDANLTIRDVEAPLQQLIMTSNDEELRGNLGREFWRIVHLMKPPVPTSSAPTHVLVRILNEPRSNPDRREMAAILLAHRGREAREALPQLTRILREPVYRSTATSGFGRFEVGFESHARFAQTILDIDANGREAIEAHAYLLQHGTRSRKWQAIHAIREFGARAGNATEALAELIVREDDAELQREGITTLGILGPAAKDAIPTLEELAEHDDPQVAERAKAALRQIKGDGL